MEVTAVRLSRVAVISGVGSILIILGVGLGVYPSGNFAPPPPDLMTPTAFIIAGAAFWIVGLAVRRSGKTR